MPQAHPFRSMLRRLFPRKMTVELALDSSGWENLDAQQKKELSDRFLASGEIALLNQDSAAVGYFEAASLLLPESFEVWYRGGYAFLDYGLSVGKDKALLLASRYFKQAVHFGSQQLEAWMAWGNTLLKLGVVYNEHHYFLEAKEKFQKALKCQDMASHRSKAQLYWDYGLAWSELAQHSGEAVDVQLAIQAFRTSMSCYQTPPSEFLTDCGNAYLQMGLLINNARLYLQAVEFVRRSLEIDKGYVHGWRSLANAYAQLYLNTMEERYATQGCEAYEELCRLDGNDAEHWLGWAQLLGESGKVGRDAKKLKSAIEIAARGLRIEANHPMLLAQWVESLSILGSQLGRLDLLMEAERKILKASDRTPDDPDLWHAYGICLIAFGQYYSDPDYYEIAIEKLQQGLSLDRTHAEIWHALALAHASIANLSNDLDMIERAKRFFARALDLKPACPSLLFDAANGHLLSCDLHDNPRDLDLAIHSYETLLQGQKETILSHPEWLFQYATALEWQGDFTGEESHYVRALDLFLHVLLIDPETPKVHFRIAMCLVRLGESTLDAEYYKRSLHYFRFAARQDEEDEAVWLEWGLASINLAHHSLSSETMQQCYRAAEEKLIRAGQLGNLNAYYNLSCLYSILGRYEEAMELIYKAEKVFALPTIEEMLEDEWLDNLRQIESFANFLSSLETKQQPGSAE